MSYLPSFRLDGKWAMVTGSSKGLGRHIALALGEAGANIILVGRSTTALEKAKQEVKELGVQAITVCADLSTDEGVDTLIPKALAQIKGEDEGIDILVNNAGMNKQQSALEVTREVWDEVMSVNLKGAFFTAQHVAKHMVKRGKGGRIVNISSQMGEVGFYKRSTYCTSKAGMLGFTRVMAIELAPYHIRVNALGPTFIDSPLADEMFKDETIKQEVMPRIPIGRLGKMEEVATGVLYLVSEGADLVNGHHLLIDGGWTTW